MSSYALNRNYNLQLPNSFVEIDREEMEYVDGGGWESVCTDMSVDKRLIEYPVNALGWWYTGVGIAKATNKIASIIAGVLGSSKYSENIGNVIGGLTGDWFNVGTHLANYLDGVDGSTDGRLSYTTCQMVWK